MAVAHKSNHKNAVRSRQMIKRAFAEMLNEKDIAKITVTDIVEKAGISRGTFYAHYMDVYDLYSAIQANMMEAVQQAVEAAGAKNVLIDPTEVILKSLTFLNAQKPYYKLFITSSRSDSLIERIVTYIGEKFNAELDGLFTDDEKKEVNCFLCYSLGAIENIVKTWLNEKLPLSAADCAALISATYLRSKPEVLSKLVPAEED